MFHVIITSCSDVLQGPTGGMTREVMYPRYRIFNCFGETIMLYCLLKPQESMRSGFETERMISGVISEGLYEENLHITAQQKNTK